MTKLTIKEEMRAIDKRDFGWWDTLTSDEQTELGKNMYVQMRYASATQSRVNEINAHYLNLINKNVNVHYNILRKHPQLQHRLLQTAGIGSEQFHPWIKPMKKYKGKKINADLYNFILESHPYYNDEEIQMVADSLTKDDIKKMLTEAGTPADKIKKYLK